MTRPPCPLTPLPPGSGPHAPCSACPGLRMSGPPRCLSARLLAPAAARSWPAPWTRLLVRPSIAAAHPPCGCPHRGRPRRRRRHAAHAAGWPPWPRSCARCAAPPRPGLPAAAPPFGACWRRMTTRPRAACATRPRAAAPCRCSAAPPRLPPRAARQLAEGSSPPPLIAAARTAATPPSGARHPRSQPRHGRRPAAAGSRHGTQRPSRLRCAAAPPRSRSRPPGTAG
eukprot:364003-Chlamydomonas_euryale.AAC.45